jgi:hypothetical protein
VAAKALNALKIVSILLLIVAVDEQRKGYYYGLRYLATAIFAWEAYGAARLKRWPWVAVLGGFAVLFNPFYRFHIGRDNWMPMDVLAASVLCLSFIFLRKLPPKPAPETVPAA